MLVGRVTEMKEESMRTIIGLTDSTGYLEVTFFHKGDTNSAHALQNFSLESGKSQWIQVCGFIRVFNSNKSVVGINLTEIKKMDLVTNHFLKVFVSSQMRHKGTLSSADLEAHKQN